MWPIEESAGAAWRDEWKKVNWVQWRLSEVAETLKIFGAHKTSFFDYVRFSPSISLWTRNLKIAVLEAARQLDITLCCFQSVSSVDFLNRTLKDIAD